MLCGGSSRRMGTSKAWLDFDGEPMLTRVARIVASVAVKTVVVGQANRSLPPLPPNCPVVCDRIRNAGPLAGIEAGLSALSASCDTALVVSCDHPLVSESFLRALASSPGKHLAIIPAHQGRTYPLVALYRVSAVQIATALLERGERRISEFVTACNAVEIEAESFVGPDEFISLANVNDPDSLAEALRWVKGPRS